MQIGFAASMDAGQPKFLLVNWAALASMFLLGACAFSNTGAVDYRRAEVLSDAERIERSDAARKSLSDKTKDKQRVDPDPILPVPLAWKNWAPSGTDNSIEKNQSITIRLTQGYTRHCTEGALNQLFGGNFNSTLKFKKNCDVAVVVSAFEMGNGKDFDFSPDGVKKGRLVYFSSDAEQKQFLNFNNMPIYGPITYNGGPIGLDIHIMEVDADSKQMQAILGTLASFGKTAYPPAAPVLSVLDSLGKSLLEGAQDDTDFRYTMVFDPRGGRPSPYAVLEAGAYAFVREENREADTPWFKLRYDENTGRLYYRDPAPNATQEQRLYRENTYLTLNIIKGLEAKGLDLQQNTFGAFRAKLDEIDEARAQRFGEVGVELQAQVQDVIAQRSQISAFDDARLALGQIEKANGALARRYGTAGLFASYAEQSLQGIRKAIEELRKATGVGNDCSKAGLEAALCAIEERIKGPESAIQAVKSALEPPFRSLSKQKALEALKTSEPLLASALGDVRKVADSTLEALEVAQREFPGKVPERLPSVIEARDRIARAVSKSFELVHEERLLYFEARESALRLLRELKKTVVFYRVPTTDAEKAELQKMKDDGKVATFSRQKTEYILRRLRQLAELQDFDEFESLTIEAFPDSDSTEDKDKLDKLLDRIAPKLRAAVGGTVD